MKIDNIILFLSTRIILPYSFMIYFCCICDFRSFPIISSVVRIISSVVRLTNLLKTHLSFHFPSILIVSPELYIERWGGGGGGSYSKSQKWDWGTNKDIHAAFFLLMEGSRGGL